MIGPFSVKQRRLLEASREQVWDAWTRPAAMKRWFCPMGMTTTHAECDVAVGGRYRVAMKPGNATMKPPPQFGDVLVAEGVYEQVIRPSLLVFTWAWVGWGETSRVSVELIEDGQHTELLLNHDRLADSDSRAFHEDGWVATLNNLCVYLTPETPDRLVARPTRLGREHLP